MIGHYGFCYICTLKFTMKLADVVAERSQHQCELCGSKDQTEILEVSHADAVDANSSIMVCAVCKSQIEKREELNSKHWECLKDSMWSEVPGVQVTAWRMLNRLRQESWAADLLDMLYLDEERLAWAKASGDQESDGSVDLHRDVNGQVLQNGDSVVLIKSLDVKGSSVNAKIGTAVRNIKLVADNTEQIEGKVDGQTIVILTKYLKKQGK